MIPKSMSSTPIGDGYRFSDKIMLNEEAYIVMSSATSRLGAECVIAPDER